MGDPYKAGNKMYDCRRGRKPLTWRGVRRVPMWFIFICTVVTPFLLTLFWTTSIALASIKRKNFATFSIATSSQCMHAIHKTGLKMPMLEIPDKLKIIRLSSVLNPTELTSKFNVSRQTIYEVIKQKMRKCIWHQMTKIISIFCEITEFSWNWRSCHWIFAESR